GSVRAAVTLGYDRTGSQGFAARSYILGTRVLAEERLGPWARVRAGADTYMQTYDFRLGEGSADDDLPRPDEAGSGSRTGVQKDVNIGAWVDAPLEIGRRASVTPGLRADVFTSRGVGS